MPVSLIQVIMEGVVGGYLGDIAISGVVLSVNDNCSFTPQEARVHISRMCL